MSGVGLKRTTSSKRWKHLVCHILKLYRITFRTIKSVVSLAVFMPSPGRNIFRSLMAKYLELGLIYARAIALARFLPWRLHQIKLSMFPAASLTATKLWKLTLPTLISLTPIGRQMPSTPVSICLTRTCLLIGQFLKTRLLYLRKIIITRCWLIFSRWSFNHGRFYNFYSWRQRTARFSLASSVSWSSKCRHRRAGYRSEEHTSELQSLRH